MKLDEVFEQMCAEVVEMMREAFKAQHNQHIFRPIQRSKSLTSEGGNKFFVGLSFEPCAGADSMSSRN